MRTARELTFRVSEELANLRLLILPSSPAVTLAGAPLPDPTPITTDPRSTEFAADLIRLADSILNHRFPTAGGVLETGDQIEWRRDYRRNITSDLKYFRRIPYLDVAKAGDHKAIWDLNRHQHLIVLAQAALLTDRREYVDEIQRQLDSWWRDNPFMRGMNWTSALEVAFRALSWMWVIHLAGDRLDPDLRRRLAVSLFQHGRYLEHNLSIYFSPNTHLLGEAVALHALGTVFSGDRTALRWKTVGGDLVRRELGRQVRDDGSHFEQSSYYHVYALDLFLLHMLFADVTPEYRLKVGRMADYLHALMGRSRTLPFLGDDDGGRVFHPYGRRDQFGRAAIATAAKLLGETKWMFEEVDLHEQAVWWLGARVLDEPPPQHPVSAAVAADSRLFSNAGLAIMVSDRLDVIVDAGPFGPGTGGHSHSDSLSVVVRRGGEELLIDPGTYTYVGDPQLRDWFRGSSAHNTVKIDGRDQAIAAGPFRWRDLPDVAVTEWTSRADYDLVDATCRYKPPSLVHRRRVLLLKKATAHDVLIICDAIDGPSTPLGTGPNDDHLVEQFWHPGEPVRRVAARQFLVGHNARLLTSDGAEADLLDVGHDGWRSREFGEKTPAATVVARCTTALPCFLWTALVVGDDAELAQCRLIHKGETEASLELTGQWSISIRFGKAGEVPYQLTPTSRAGE